MQCKEYHAYGHMRKNCPRVTCTRCGELGHIVSLCPQPVVCLRYKQLGHIRREYKTVILRAHIAELRPIVQRQTRPTKRNALGNTISEPEPTTG
jgi:hypothetical protein